MGRKAQRASQLFQAGPKWKREFVPDHKFDFVDLHEFRTRSCWFYIRYILMYLAILISIATYCADIWSACILLIYNQWSLISEPKIPLYISKWIFVGCIAISFILLAWEIRKARIVMASRDISYAATNNIVFRYIDSVAFYVFFTLKGYKRLVFADGPRQIIAGFTIYAILKTAWTNEQGSFQFNDDSGKYGKDWQQVIALCLMSFTCVIWVIRILGLLLAILLYIPVFCQIQGNLKEYCCHKIDKRITHLLEKQRRRRLERLGTQNKKTGDHPVMAPTLPTIADDYDAYSDKRPLHYDYSHDITMSPMSQRLYRQPTYYQEQEKIKHHHDYYDIYDDDHTSTNESYYNQQVLYGNVAPRMDPHNHRQQQQQQPHVVPSPYTATHQQLYSHSSNNYYN